MKVDKSRVKKIIQLFKKYYPNVECALHYSTPEELLIATILSAQCTDARVNMVTEGLFKKYKNVEAFAKANLKQLEKDVKPTGFYKNKAKNIKLCCQKLVKDYNSKVPQNLEELVQLNGVGRKTANVVLGNAFGIASGVVVDTHVTRISNKLGFVNSKNAVVIERELNELIDKKYWIEYPHWLIHHGRTICKARSPKCDQCFLSELCPSSIDKG